MSNPSTVTVRVDLHGLQRELDGFKTGRLDKWAQGAVASSEAQKEEHYKRIREFQTAIRDLNQQQRELERRAQEVKQRLEAEHSEADGLEQELARVRAEQDALPAAVDEVRGALDAEAREVDRRAAALADQEAVKQRKLGALRQALQMYRDRLGLAFEHSAGEQLDVVFTRVDAARPERAFTFAVQVVEDDQYRVRSCDPPVAALPALVDQLNASNDFSAFVRSMRREFKAAASGGTAET